MAPTDVSRRRFIRNAGIGAASLAAFGPLTFTRTRGPRPNILYIMADDHACQAISCYGSKINKTPNIDRIAQEGVRFNQSFCTNSVCAPSRAVLLTGKYSHLNSVRENGDVFDGSQETFPKILQRAGYATAIFGKWHLTSDPTGFDYWNILPGQGLYYNPDFIEMGTRSRRDGYATDLITDYGINWIRQQKSGRPFCAILHHKAPHRNWMPDARHLSMYEEDDLPVPETFADDYATRSDAARQQEMQIARHMTLSTDLKYEPDTTKELVTAADRRDLRDWSMMLKRLTDEQRAAWRAAYDPRNEVFRKSGLTVTRSPVGNTSGTSEIMYAASPRSMITSVERWTSSMRADSQRIPSLSILPTRASIWVNMAGSTSGACTKNPCVCPFSFAIRQRSLRASRMIWC